MALYSFECKTCRVVEDRVFGMMEVKARERVVCSTCGMKMARVYLRPQVNPDTWGRPRTLSYLNSMDGDPLGPVQTFETRTDERKYKEAHARKFGWS